TAQPHSAGEIQNNRNNDEGEHGPPKKRNSKFETRNSAPSSRVLNFDFRVSTIGEQEKCQQKDENQHLLSTEVHPVSHKPMDARQRQVMVKLAGMMGPHVAVLNGELRD